MPEQPTPLGTIPTSAWWNLAGTLAGVLVAGLTLWYLIGADQRETRQTTLQWQFGMASDIAVIKNTLQAQSNLQSRMEKEIGRKLDAIHQRLHNLERETFPPRQFPPP